SSSASPSFPTRRSSDLAVGLVAHVADALDALLAHHFHDPLDQGLLVDLIGQLGDDDGLAVLADRLDRGLAAHHDRAAALAQGVRSEEHTSELQSRENLV